MNTVKVQFEIHDVVQNDQKKSKYRRPQTAQGIPSKNNTDFQSSVRNSSNKSRSMISEIGLLEAPRKSMLHDAASSPDFPQITKPSTSHILRRNPRPVIDCNKPDWNTSLTVPDRDLLIIDQDLEVAKFRDSHSGTFYSDDNGHKPEPKLTQSNTRVNMKHESSEEKRDRLVHHSFGAVVNNPLPFYPHLHLTSGIHSTRWEQGSKPDIDLEGWSKPASKAAAKSQQDFQKIYRIPVKRVPAVDINVQHSIYSVDSTYTKAEARMKSSQSHSRK